MKRIHFFAVILALSALLCTFCFAKTHTTDIIPAYTIEYTLEEEDKLSAELFIDEDGLYNMKIVSMSSEKFTPKISVTISQSGEEIYKFETKSHLLDDGSFINDQVEFSVGLTEGEYKVVVENLTMFSSVSFKIETSFLEEENIETVKNNSFENATNAFLNAKYHGGVTMANETDYYTFEMPYDGYAFVQMYSPQLKFFTLFDENKYEIGSIGIEIDEADKVYELRTGLAKGRYYIAIQPDEDFSSPLYTIEINAVESDGFEKEYNNRKELSTPIISGKEYQGNLFGIYDEDVYSFCVTEDSGITLEFTDTLVSKDGHYSIYLSDGENVLFSSDECGRETAVLNLGKGTYYFTVSGLGYSRFTSMAYKLKVTSDKPLAACPPEEDAGSQENESSQKELLQFSDVKSSDWYADDLFEARKEGLIEGLEGNIYNPRGSVTLAEAITMAVRVHSRKSGVQVDFSISGNKWYEPYIQYATDKKLIKSNDFENHERPATRAEVAYIFSSVFEEIESNDTISIPDVDHNTRYYESIYKLYHLGILKGDDEKGTFNPERNFSRAEAATILLRIHRT